MYLNTRACIGMDARPIKYISLSFIATFGPKAIDVGYWIGAR